MIIEALYCALFSWVFCLILLDEGMIFSWYYKKISMLPDWLNKPLGTCEYCFGGQVALWYYLYQYHSSYSLISHVVFICGVIFAIRITNKLLYGQ